MSQQLRELVTLFDTCKDKKVPLDKARAMGEDARDTDSPNVNTILAYSMIVRGLCSISLTGASERIAELLENASVLAWNEQNRKLAMYAKWYGACCRLMRFTFRGEHRPVEVINDMSLRFLSLGTAAGYLHDPERQALAAAMVVECGTLMKDTPRDDLRKKWERTYRLLENADQTDPRVEERIAYLDALRLNNFTPPASWSSNYELLLYTPGELLGTIE